MSSTRSLTSLPPEILATVLELSGTIRDAVSLSSTCQHLRGVFIENQRSILDPIVRRNFIAYSDAIVGVRVTKIARTWLRKLQQAAENDLQQRPRSRELYEGDLLNLFKLLPSKDYPPDLDEIARIYVWKHLIDCVLKKLSSKDCVYLKEWNECPDLTLETESGLIDPRTYKLYCAFYRVLMVGAYLAPAYMEPFYQDDNMALQLLEIYRDHTLRDRFKRKGDFEDIESGPDRHRLLGVTEETVPYLKGFPIWNYDVLQDDQDTKSLDLIITPMAKFIMDPKISPVIHVRDSQNIIFGYPPESVTKEDNQIHQFLTISTAWLLMRNQLRNMKEQYLGREEANPFKDEEQKAIMRQKHVEIILYGIFQVEEISVPEDINDSTNTDLVAYLVPLKPTQPDNPSHQLIDVNELMCSLRVLLGPLDPNAVDHTQLLPPPLTPRRMSYMFFMYVLRKYFRLRFAMGNWTDKPGSRRLLGSEITFTEILDRPGIDGLDDDPWEYTF